MEFGPEKANSDGIIPKIVSNGLTAQIPATNSPEQNVYRGFCIPTSVGGTH